jgi:azurin
MDCGVFVQEMGESMKSQMGHIDVVGQKTESMHGVIKVVQQGARKDFRLKVK